MEPGFEEYMLPVLKVMNDGRQRRNNEIWPMVLDEMGLKAEDLIELIYTEVNA